MRWQPSTIHSNPQKQPPEVESKEQSYSTNPSDASSPRILIAEDDKALRELMAHLLAFEGYFITEAADAHAMLQVVHASRQSGNDAFDLIVTDVRMPGLTGLDALASLREAGCRTPAIVVSAFPEDAVQQQARDLNASFLPKPFALENLRRMVNRAVYDYQVLQSQASGVT
jgi:CheY-like chemotaxis protein